MFTCKRFETVASNVCNGLVLIKRVPRRPNESDLRLLSLPNSVAIGGYRCQVVKPHSDYIHTEVPYVKMKMMSEIKI